MGRGGCRCVDARGSGDSGNCGLRMLGFILLAIAAYVVVPKLIGAEKWTGVFYPSRSDLSVHQFVGEFDTLEQCRDYTLGIVDRLVDPNEADWECGLNCKPFSDDPVMLVCEKTER